jgi:tetratricopeptide (TPR) repeat protein
MAFYAPVRGFREVRDRAPLAAVGLMALISQLLYVIVREALAGNRVFLAGPGLVIRILFYSALPVLAVGAVLVPIVAFVAKVFERRGRFSLLLQQEYVSLASTFLYALLIANLLTIPIAIFFHYSGVQASNVVWSVQSAAELDNWRWPPPDDRAHIQNLLRDPVVVSANLFRWVKLFILLIGTVLSLREVFRISASRAFAIFMSGLALAVLTSPLWVLLLSPVLASPFLLLIAFLLIRGYISGALRSQRARESFKQNLEAATLNPLDASAHYNLGLIHQQRGEVDAARERFERALQIDEDEIDAHYQLGRIALQQKRFSDAVRHFEQVVSRDPSHSQYEIWREVGATYIAAGQFEDARDALERFLEHRPSDPEALYLMGRAHAGLGHRREAASSMQACIEAVKTAPAYKYRADKRWLNEAQQFIKSSQ